MKARHFPIGGVGLFHVLSEGAIGTTREAAPRPAQSASAALADAKSEYGSGPMRSAKMTRFFEVFLQNVRFADSRKEKELAN